MERFIQMLTRMYDARVVFCGVQAGTDGRRIQIPDVSLLARDNMTDEEIKFAKKLLLATKGYVIHEGSHIMHSDFELMIAAALEHGLAFKVLNNRMDDIRIEWRTGSHYRGAKQVLDFTRQEWVWPRVAKERAEHLEETGERVHWFELLDGLQLIANHNDYEDHFLWKSLAEENQNYALQFRDECIEIRKSHTLDKTPGTRRCIEISLSIWEQIKQDFEDASEAAGKGDDKGDDKGDEEGDDKGEGPRSIVVTLGGPAEDAESDDSGSGGESGDDDDQEQEGTESGAESPSEGKDKGEDKGDDGEGAESPSKPSSVRGREVHDVEPEGAESGSSGAPEGSAEGERMRCQNPDTVTKETTEEALAGLGGEIAKDITEAVEVIARELVAEHREYHGEGSKPYLVYTNENDIIGKRPDATLRDSGEALKRLRDETHRTHGAVKRQLQQLLRSIAKDKVRSDLDDGDDIDPGSLYKLATGTSDRIFRTKVESYTLRDTVVGLMIDASGSMAGGGWGYESAGRIELAIRTAFAFGECLDAANIPFAIWSFTSHHGGEANRRFDAASELERELFSRWGNLYILTAKNFHEPWIKYARYVPFLGEHLEQNHDAEAVRFAAHQLLQQKQKRRVLFVLSDGMPATGEPGNCDYHQDLFLHEVVKNMRAHNVEVVGIGIQTDCVDRYYKPQSVVVNDVSELPTVTLKQMKFLLLNQRKRHRR